MSLWDKYDNRMTAAPGARYRRTRQVSQQAIVSSTRKWLLLDYAPAYCRALGAARLYRRCYWVDAWGFARGASQDPSATQAVLALSKALAHEDKPLTFKGLFLDAGSSRRRRSGVINGVTARQAESSQHEVLPGESDILRANWPEIAPALLKEIEHVPAIFLLNPFGLNPFTYDDLALLYQRSSAPTELCLLLVHSQLEMHAATASRSAAPAASLTALLRTDRWKALLVRGEGSGFDASTMVDLLQASMRQHFRWVQPIPLSVQVRPAVVEALPCTLLFASRHRDGLLSMNDALCVHRRRLYATSHQGILAEDWFAQQEYERFAAAIQQLSQRVLQLGQAQRARRWPELRLQLLLEHFGQFTLHDYDEVICDLLLKQKVRCEWRSPAPASDFQRRVPGNEDNMLWK